MYYLLTVEKATLPSISGVKSEKSSLQSARASLIVFPSPGCIIEFDGGIEYVSRHVAKN